MDKGFKNHWLNTTWLLSVLGLAALRFWQLDADPASHYIRTGASLVTDPYYYTYFSRNAVLFGDWLPFDYDRYSYFMYSIVSGFSYIMFSLFGVSRVVAHLAALILNLTGVYLYLVAVFPSKRELWFKITLLVLLANPTFLVWSRYPILESGLMFLTGLTCFIFFRYASKLWGQYLTGACLALTILIGKLLGAILVIPILVILWIDFRENSWRPVINLLIGAIAVGATYVLIFFDGSLSVLTSYASEVLTMYGSSSIDFNITTLTHRFFSYIASPQFSEYSSYTIIAGLLGIILFLLRSDWQDELKNNRQIIFAIVWLIASYLILAPQNYRPMRHALTLILPISLFAGYCFSQLKNYDIDLRLRKNFVIASMISIASVMIVILMIVPQVEYMNRIAFAASNSIWWLLAGCGVVGLLYLLCYRKNITITRTIRYGLIICWALGISWQNGHQLWLIFSSPKYEINHMNSMFKNILTSESVVCGNFAPALTFDTKVKGILDFFGPINGDPEMIENNKVTHLIASRPTLINKGAYYQLEGQCAEQYFLSLRGSPVSFWRVNKSYNKSLSAFDTLKYTAQQGMLNETVLFGRELLKRDSTNVAIWRMYLYALPRTTNTVNVISEIERCSRILEDCYPAQWVLTEVSGRLYKATNDIRFKNLTTKHFNLANQLDPVKDITIQDFWNLDL